MPSREITVDPEKQNKFVNILLMKPTTCVADAMRSAEFTEEDITDLRIRRFLQRALPGGSIKGLKAFVAGPRRSRRFRSSRPLVDEAAIVANNVEEAAIVHVERTPPLAVNSIVNVEPRTQCMTVSSSVTQSAAAKRKARNMRFYQKKKKRRDIPQSATN